MNVLVTGANGFVGKALCRSLVKQGFEVCAVVRSPNFEVPNVNVVVKELTNYSNWQNILTKIDVVIHLAGRAHVMKENAKDSYQAYSEINVEATKHLAEQSVKHGVKRFIFMSSVGVIGNSSQKPFTEKDQLNPQALYAVSKKNAEGELRLIASISSMEVVIIRPPLVYGSGAKGNFERLTKLCGYKLPLPLGAIDNKRSLVYLGNLVDFISVCINHPKAANETFLISDDEDVSTTQLIQTIADVSGNNMLLMPMPEPCLVFILQLLGKKSLSIRLLSDLQVDVTKAKTILGWKPPYTFEMGIEQTVGRINND